MIKIENLKFKYYKKNILNNISLNFDEKNFTSIIGINGSGKTTLIKIMMRLLKPDNGELVINDSNIRSFKSKEFAKKVAYIPQNLIFPEGTTVYDFVSFGRNPYTNMIGTLTKNDKKYIDEALKMCGIHNLKDSLLTSLSGGQKQLCAIALTVAQDSDIVLLDEPNSYLDIYNTDEIMNILRHLVDVHKKTIIMTIHDINQASKFSDQIIIIKNGKIFAHDEPLKIINKQNLIECFKIKAEINIFNNKPVIIDYRKAK